MRPPVLISVLLWLRGFLAKEDNDACGSLPPGDEHPGGPPLEVNVSSQGRPTSLFLSWASPEPGASGHALQLTALGPPGSPEGRQIQALTNASSFTFLDLVPGSPYRLEVTALRPCGQNVTVTLTTQTPPAPVHNLQLRPAASPASLEATWDAAPGQQDSLQLLLQQPESQTWAQNVTLAPGTLAYTFSDLLPGSEYVVEVTTRAGTLSAKTSAQQWTAPVVPSELTMRALGTTALQASWNGSEGAAWLHLTLRDPGGTNLTVVARRGTTNHTFRHLSPGTRYELTLRATAGPYGTGGPNATEWTYPVAPLNLKLVPQPPELWVGWQAGPGAQDGYLLRLTGQTQWNASLGPSALNTTFPGPLTAGHYTLELRALAGPYHASTQASVWLDGPLPPQSLEVTDRGSPSELAIGWAAPLGELEGYGVAWRQEDDQQTQGSRIDVGPGNTSLILGGLMPGSCYSVSVWAWAGNSSSSTQSTHACTLPAPPANLSLGWSSQPPALTASWSAPPGGRDGFQLQLYSLRPLTLNTETRLEAGAQNFSWAQLPAGTEFLAQLRSLRGLDESSSANATGWTPPLAPALVNVTSEGPSQLRVSWAHSPGGREGYQVTLSREGTPVGTSSVEAEVGSVSFSDLLPGTQYEVEIVSWAGPLHQATSSSGWTSPILPNELLVSMQAGQAVINLAWAGGPLGQGQCHARLSEGQRLSWEQPLMLGQALLVLRDLTPGRNLSLSVQCRAGPLEAATHPVLLPVEPGPVEDVLCQPKATRLALNWTLPTGDLGACLVVVEQLEAEGSVHPVFQANVSGATLVLTGLVPATSYRLSLAVLGRNGLWSRTVTLVCSTAAEAWHPPELAAAPQLEPGMGMGVVITRGMFGKDDGQIQWYGIIATTNSSLTRPPPEAVNCTWYHHYYQERDSYLAILLPNPFYPGPWAVPRSWMVPVGTEDCGQTREICNGPLKLGVQYRFGVVAFTRHLAPETTMSFSAFSEPRTSVPWTVLPFPVVAGIAGGSILVLCALLGLVCCWRRVKGQRADKKRFSQELTAYNLRRTHRPIPLHSFRQSVEAKSAHANQAFFQEFEELKEVGREQPRLEAQHPANAAKNRYPHVLPYDHSRVRLAQLEGEPHSDYINANFIPGHAHPQEFIATQGPLKRTLEDFWRLVWEQQIHMIVMLTVGMENGRVLCEHYWPADPNPVTHGHITVHLLAEEPEDEWTRREFQLQHSTHQQERRVKQLQFTTWPDHGVPEAPTPLLAFTELVRTQARASQGTGPILVHCSAGVGRTGTFVALLRLLQQLEEEQTVDVFNAVYALRMHRPLMIQTPSQYIFLHSCLLNKILEGPPNTSEVGPIPVASFEQACAKRAAHANAGFVKEYKLLLQAIQDQTHCPMPPPGYEQDLVPYAHCPGRFVSEERGQQKEAPPGGSPEAWLFPGGISGHDHVVLTGPSRPQELWELVWEHGAHVLVSLCPPDAGDKEFWPSESQPVVLPNMVTVHWVTESSASGWPCTLLRVCHGLSGTERQVQWLQMPSAEPGQELPVPTLLAFLTAVDCCCSQDQKKPHTLLSHSSKGTAQLTTFLALDRLLQQAGADCTVDVFSVALQQSQACGLMTPTLEQYIDLYKCLCSALVDRLG
ncbi:receptor-type tyrosine-protein phosphatase V-like [Sorex fumeus]|uniref:receptor-type tyrosine-protein phosphatase V-like n=1 Tax=Sorex fumeus TaxID=62283 RepID=UPI0024AD5CEC|nr:receptor-type tyrosine-protein phosphatase V-like [Sorex fumeus]